MRKPKPFTVIFYVVYVAIAITVISFPLRECFRQEVSEIESLEEVVTQSMQSSAISLPTNPDFDLPIIEPSEVITPLIVPEIEITTPTVNLDFRLLEMSGFELASLQIERGCAKPKYRRKRDQSLEGLRDIIADSQDSEIRGMLSLVDSLENCQSTGHTLTYQENLVKEFLDLARFVEQETNIPASVLLAQVIIESGWGTSNITILKNNVLGIGNAIRPNVFTVNLQLGGIDRDLTIRALQDTTAYAFDSVGDCVLYYVYLLLHSERNRVHYSDLREYLKDNPTPDKSEVIRLIAKKYHHDPSRYQGQVSSLSEWVEKSILWEESQTCLN